MRGFSKEPRNHSRLIGTCRPLKWCITRAVPPASTKLAGIQRFWRARIDQAGDDGAGKIPRETIEDHLLCVHQRHLQAPPDTARSVERAFAAHNCGRCASTARSPEGLRILRVDAAGLLLENGSPLRLYLGEVDGVPAATAEADIGGGVVGLYNICTAAAWRRRGIATAMTLRALADGLADGWTTAVLQASAAGAKIYGPLGFEPFGTVAEYKPAGPRASA